MVTLPAKISSLHSLQDLIRSQAEVYGYTERELDQIELTVEEALVNIFEHAYVEREGNVEVECETGGSGLVVRIVDQGRSFDLREAIRGTGLQFIHTFAKGIEYERVEGKNIVRLLF